MDLSVIVNSNTKNLLKDFLHSIYRSVKGISFVLTLRKGAHAVSPVEDFLHKPLISVVMPVYNVEKVWLKKAIQSVRDQIYLRWELCVADDASSVDGIRKTLDWFSAADSRIKVTFLREKLHLPGAANEAMKMAEGEFVAFLDHDDALAPFALHEVAKLLNEHPDLDFIYSDEDKISQAKEEPHAPFFKPDWSPDTFLSYNYICRFAVIRKTLIDKIGGFRAEYEGAQDYDLFLRVVQRTTRIHRIPKILYHQRAGEDSGASELLAKPYALDAAKKALRDHLNAKGIKADVVVGFFPASYRVRYEIEGMPKVSIIIPTRDKVALLTRCVSSIFDKTDYPNYEIVVVDNGSREEETSDYLRTIAKDSRVKIKQFTAPFNYASINNFAVQSTESEYLLFLNNDTEVISREWLSAMLEFAQRSDVGAVGAKLLYPNDTIQHAGVIIGVGGVGSHAHLGFPITSHGYFGRISVIQNLSAVTGACMMVRRSVFEEVGGFDETLSLAYNDIDLCLKIRDKKYLIVYTPYAELYHHESASRGYEDTPEKQARFWREVEIVRTRWKSVFEKGDPYYNPNLSLEKCDFRIGP